MVAAAAPSCVENPAMVTHTPSVATRARIARILPRTLATRLSFFLSVVEKCMFLVLLPTKFTVARVHSPVCLFFFLTTTFALLQAKLVYFTVTSTSFLGLAHLRFCCPCCP